MSEMLNRLATRRSVVAKELCEPGPDKKELAQILEIGARVPDHGKLAPWRFIVFKKSARTSFGQELASLLLQRDGNLSQAKQEAELTRFERAPVVICVISSPKKSDKIPRWEQRLSAGAVCQNILLAATALGYSCQWITEWCAFDEDVRKLMGVRKREKIAGFIYIGSARSEPKERSRPVMEDIVSFWNK